MKLLEAEIIFRMDMYQYVIVNSSRTSIKNEAKQGDIFYLRYAAKVAMTRVSMPFMDKPTQSNGPFLKRSTRTLYITHKIKKWTSASRTCTSRVPYIGSGIR